MPCNSDYLEPSARERNSRRFCGHVCYLLDALGREVPDWARKGADEYYGDAARVNDATILLCETIRSLSAEQLEKIVYDGRSKRARALADFWDAHQDADAKREQDQRVRREREHASDEEELQRLARKLGREVK